MNKRKLNINIAGSFTTDLLDEGLRFWLDKIGLSYQLAFTGYNQVLQELLDVNSIFNAKNNQINIILIRFEDYINDDETKPSVGDELISAMESYAGYNVDNKLYIILCPPSAAFFNDEAKKLNQLEFERKIESANTISNNIHVLHYQDYLFGFTNDDFEECDGISLGHIPYTVKFFSALSTAIAKFIFTTNSELIKAVVVDCDNTLWAGVVGETGYENIIIAGYYRELQRFLLDLSNKGILICLCSKNNEKDVWDVFEKNPQMILKKDNIAFSRINWEPKSRNIINLSKEINIGLDSFVFIDDNPIECEDVKINCPSVIVINWKDEEISFLKENWIFSKDNVTEEDKKRTVFYREEGERNQLKTKYKLYSDFINSLKIKININALENNDFSRISQLSFRTNQFNFTTKRRTEIDMRMLHDKDNFQIFKVELSDKLGSYGIVGGLILEKRKKQVFVDSFFLSCRALGKGVEHRMISFLGEYANSENLETIIVPFIVSEKNKVAETFLDSNFQVFEKNEKEKTYKLITIAAMEFSFNPDAISKLKEEQKDDNLIGLVSNSIVQRNSLVEYLLDTKIDINRLTSEIYYPEIKIKVPSKQKKADIEKAILAIWKIILKNNNIKSDDNFFEIGGESIVIPQIIINCKKIIEYSFSIVDFFHYPTVEGLTNLVFSTKNIPATAIIESETYRSSEINQKSNDIAIIGMSGRFPGAKNIEEYWEIIKEGTETISHYSREELLSRGVSLELLDNPDYVYSNGFLEDGDCFDANFFGITPKEALFMDPQHRIFLETCYNALENAGYTAGLNNNIGVFSGSGPNNYLLKNLLIKQKDLFQMGELQTITNNGKDYLSTLVSYKLNLHGPSMTIQTACSTSLVCVHTACQNLLAYQCDMALAGGVFIQVPRGKGYLYKRGEIFSKTGHCRPFDVAADGMLFGEGSAAVVLKRLDDAIKDKDNIWAVIKSSAINNDGNRKVGYMAPSIDGQVGVIKKAQESAAIFSKDVTYVETHGTGTKVGDPIEIRALNMAFNDNNRVQPCTLGSVKANIGHLDAASGVASLIKVVLMLHHKVIPPIANFSNANPELSLEETPFQISTERNKKWESTTFRTAGISSFGVGGTNVHCLLQEYNSVEPIKESTKQEYHFFAISAKTDGSLKNYKKEMIDFISNDNNFNLSDLSYTLLVGRERFNNRAAFFYKDRHELLQKLKKPVFSNKLICKSRLVFLFPGQGSQYVNMSKDLYNCFDVFKNILDEAELLVEKYEKFSLKELIFNEEHEKLINETQYAQIALFVVEFGLFKLLESFKIKPDVVIGHSLGEIAAACASDLFSFEDGIKLVLLRARLMQSMSSGKMLSISCEYSLISEIIPDQIDLAVINSPMNFVVSGGAGAIDDFQNTLNIQYPDVHTVILQTSHPFHSRFMDEASKSLESQLIDIKFQKNTIPIVSNIYGREVIFEEIADIQYWANQIRSTVNFNECISTCIEEHDTIFMEIGPSNVLTALLSLFKEYSENDYICIPTMRHPKTDANDNDIFLDSISKLWCSGIDSFADSYYSEEGCKRIPLPGYPFERVKYWEESDDAFNFNIIQLPKEDDKSNGAIKDFKDTINEEKGETLHEQITSIWEDYLGIDNIDPDMDFLDLGGHSLLSAQIVNKINDIYKTDLKQEALFSLSTINKLVAFLSVASEEQERSEKIVRIEKRDSYPVSQEQARIWLVSQMYNSPVYNIPFTYKLSGDLNLLLFKENIERVLKKHLILNSIVKSNANGLCLVYPEHFDSYFKIVDYTKLNSIDKGATIDSYLKEETRRNFDLENDKLYRMYLIKETESEFIFHMVIHHLVFDGWSWGIFVRDLNMCYSTPEITDEGLYQFHDYTVWMETQTPDYKKNLEYWTNKLENCSPMLNFPFDRERSDELPSGFGEREFFSYKKNLGIETLCKEMSVTPFCVFISAYAILLHKYSGDNDLCIGIPIANRRNSITEDIIGFFVNTLIIRTKLTKDHSFAGFLKETNQSIREAMAHQDIPFNEIVAALNPKRNLNMNPLFQVQFAWQSTPREDIKIPGMHTERYNITECASPLDLTFYMWEEDDVFKCDIEYNIDLIDRTSIKELGRDYFQIIELLPESLKLNVIDSIS